MRLIDADALREALGITGTADTCNGCKYNKGYYYCNTEAAPRFAYVCECIDDAPTVDAVPVEWIKKYMSRCLAIEQDAIGEMIKEWTERKEE